MLPAAQTRRCCGFAWPIARWTTIASLKGLHRAVGPGGNTELSVAPDGSAVFTRDIGTQEIYALTVKWP
jgi:hypothetical protein